MVFSLLGNVLLFWLMDIHIAPYLPGDFLVEGGWRAYIFLAILLGVLNTFVRPFLDLLTLPFRLLTLGLFSIVINALLLWLLEAIVPYFTFLDFSFAIHDWKMYVIGGVILGLFHGVFHWFEGAGHHR
ncbi:MAG: phage holin family protein [Candidatus Gracilibacteria bacterium]|nr:phage holin family protein [Candidatus Gracilibacteria bacterium]